MSIIHRSVSIFETAAKQRNLNTAPLHTLYESHQVYLIFVIIYCEILHAIQNYIVLEAVRFCKLSFL